MNETVFAAEPSRLGNAAFKACLLLLLVPFLYVSLYTHPAADDFTFVHQIRRHGLLGAQVEWYTTWTGRFFSSALITLAVHSVDLTTQYPVFPLVILGALFLSLWAFLRSLAPAAVGVPAAFWGAVGLLALYLGLMPSTFEGVYWLSGAATHQLANVFVLLLLALLFRARPSVPWWKAALRAGAACLLAAAAAGSNELTMLLLLGVCALGTAAAFALRHHARWTWACVLGAALLASAAVVLAPGNRQRERHFPNKADLRFTVANGVRVGFKKVLNWSLRPELLAAALLAIPFARRVSARAGLPRAARLRKLAALACPAAAVGAVVVSFFPSYWTMGEDPPFRLLNTIFLLFLLGGFLSVFLLAAVFLKPDGPAVPRYLVAAARVVLVVGLLYQGHFRLAVWDSLRYAPLYERRVRQRYESVRAAVARGRTKIVVPSLKAYPTTMTSTYFSELSTSPSDYRNAMLADYFGLKSIALEGPPAPAGAPPVQEASP